MLSLSKIYSLYVSLAKKKNRNIRESVEAASIFAPLIHIQTSLVGGGVCVRGEREYWSSELLASGKLPFFLSEPVKLYRLCRWWILGDSIRSAPVLHTLLQFHTTTLGVPLASRFSLPDSLYLSFRSAKHYRFSAFFLLQLRCWCNLFRCATE